jgi:hypothetical protein
MVLNRLLDRDPQRGHEHRCACEHPHHHREHHLQQVAKEVDGVTAVSSVGMPLTLPFSPDTIRWRRTAIVELRKLGIDL